jgi:hypothetical protein
MRDDRNVLQVLRAELEFLESGGYRNEPRSPWRPKFVFEDSHTCINYENQEHPKPCSECLLMQFVPPDRRETRYPCRHIQLNPRGETVTSFYEWGTEDELEKALKIWLRKTIRELESEGQSGAQTH